MIADHYSVIVIPKDRAKIRRWQISRRRVLSVLVFSCGFFGFVFFSVAGFLYYKGEYSKTSDLRSRGERYEQERLKLVGRLQELEGVVQRTENLASKLERAAGLNNRQVKVGLGPLDVGDKKGMQLASLNLKEMTKPAEYFDESSLKVVNLKAIDLQEEAQDVENRLDQVFHLKRDPNYFWASMPTVWPVKGWVTSDFGMRRSPLTGARQLHGGVDIAAPYGANITAPGDGVVTYAGPHGGYGRALIIDHGYGMATMYGHASKLLVKEGDVVKRGMKVAQVGSTGRSTGPHLHYEVLIDGVPANPKHYILNDAM